MAANKHGATGSLDLDPMERFRKRQKIFNNRNEQLQRLLQKQQYQLQQDSPQSLPSYTVPPSPNPNLISPLHPSSE